MSLRIGMVCFPSHGGSGVVATELALGLAERGHAVHLIAAGRPGRLLGEHPGVHLHEVFAPRAAPLDESPFPLVLASTLARLSAEQRLDLIHAHYAIPHAVSAVLASQLSAQPTPRLVTALHGTDVTSLAADPNYQPLLRWCVENSDGVTAPSHFLEREARRLLTFEGAITVQPNFVDTVHFAPPPGGRDRRRLHALFRGGAGAQPDGPILFHVSNCRPVKRVGDLVEVLAHVRKVLPARLVVVGDGPERAAAETQAVERGLAAHVAFLGERDDFAADLAHADAFLLPSQTESFGLAALEALSSGVPVFGYRVGGLPEVVNDATGRLVAPFDVEALATALIETLRAPALVAELGAAARARALEMFQRGPALDRIEVYYEDVMSRPRRPSPGAFSEGPSEGTPGGPSQGSSKGSFKGSSS